jgi:hypothetical protein
MAALLATLATSTAAATENPPQPAGQADCSPSSPPVDGPTAVTESGPASLMKFLAQRGLHDLKDESWNAYAQFTYISSWKPAFPAAYTNLNGSINSLTPDPEHSFTGTVTLFLGLKLWSGGEAYYAPEVIAERPFSQLRGLGGAIQNFELQKTGGETPQLYRSRGFLRQTFGLGGGVIEKESDQLQLGGKVDRRRIVLTLGNFSILDFQDKNTFTSDTRQQFLSMGFMTYAAWDFASDARGYSWGVAAEFYYDDWAIRFARISPPQNPNQLPVGLRLDRYYGDSFEIEHQHKLLGREGVLRLLAFRNREFMGRFDDAIAAFLSDPGKNAAACTAFNYGSQNASAPDLCWVRKPNVKVGIGLNVEQHLTDDIGVFFRGMYSDGQTEVQAYTSSDRSVSLGALGKGSAWSRPADVAGVGAGAGWISRIHADYLRMGGIDGFIGDGNIHQATEVDIEVFYSLNFLHAFWLTGDYQRIWNPAFNADRGPVNVFGLRLHGQY